ncbi:phosphatidylglycerophosphatase A [Polynucleobacter sp. MWH-UH2A]|uniref:phosphatidylglycerophosphatase A family protein n=1 Tax=Polynucleobacter sp. MWH-UH2A TaxID=1855617 RepID=UPI001BFD3332|nr:phosphatidylglycerophosphatase A [Polynucleobacter sp. MWH-UH2A]QWD64278.1 phosphatidylglycerophosphatase A [Polynucleobacter sp. MWH-UH2A]
MNKATQQALSLKPDFKWMLGSVNRIFAFGFGSGLSTVAPGTAGTLWAWAIFLMADYIFPLTAMPEPLWILGAGFVWGCWICGSVSEELGRRDFGGIVWDEMIAFWIVLAIIMPANLWMQILAFALFRFFDAVKPGPIGMIDRHFKKTGNLGTTSTRAQIWWRGFGIMIDDLAAALFTLLVIALVQMIALYLA